MYHIKPVTLDIDKYVLTIDDAAKREWVEKLLGAMNRMFTHIKYSDDVEIEHIPEIRIRDSSECNAEGSGFVILVDRGLIDCCYDLNSNILDCIDEIDEPCIGLIKEIPGVISISAFVWAMAHEFYHVARTHNDRINEEFPKNVHELSALKKGAEYDADLLALFHVYRSTKLTFAGLFPNESIDMLSRKVVFCAVFTLLRHFPNSEPSNSHPTRVRRIKDLIGKLAMIRANREEPFDENFEFPDSKNRYSIFVPFMVKCERQFVKEHGYRYGDLFKEIENESSTDYDVSHVAAWDDMKIKSFKAKD